MTRPAIDYDTTLTRPTQVVSYRANGSVYSKDVQTTSLERRLCHKPASIKTTPRLHGQYSDPTSYSYWWGRFFPISTYAGCSKKGLFPSDPVRFEWFGPPNDSLGFDVAALLPVPAFVENELLIKALNKLRQSNANIGVILAEAKQTASLFSETTARIAKGVGFFQKKYPKDWIRVKQFEIGHSDWRRRSHKIPQGWLELQYGWNPLMSDLSGACQSFGSSIQLGKRTVFAVKAKKKLERTTEVFTQFVPPYVGTNTSVRQKLDAKVILCYRLRNFGLALFSSLGLTNPAEIIWEKLPYSFVVDWFSPVGSWLSALGGDFGYDFVNGCYSRFMRFDVTGQSNLDYPEWRNLGGGGFGGDAVRFTRSVYSSSPWPGLYFKSPVSPGHIANALSLLTQVFRH